VRTVPNTGWMAFGGTLDSDMDKNAKVPLKDKPEDDSDDAKTNHDPQPISANQSTEKSKPPKEVEQRNESEETNFSIRKRKTPWLEIKLLGGILAVGLFLYYSTRNDLPVSKTPEGPIVFGPESIVSVYDGDTFRVNLPNLPSVFSDAMPIRLAGIDAAEMADTEGEVLEYAQKAQAFTERALMNAGRIELRNVQRGKYFRIVADVIVDGESLSQLLLKEELVKEYNGTGARADW
jgi:micrococcal nuclease